MPREPSHALVGEARAGAGPGQGIWRRELALMRSLVEDAPAAGSALLIRGAPRAGKSALVGALADDLGAHPFTVLRASGTRAEANLPYAGLHQLLRPVLGQLGSLRRPQRRAIEAAFRMTASRPPDAFVISCATLDLLSRAARPGLVVIVEDAHLLDRPTIDVLTFVARRLTPDPIVLLITARDDRPSRILASGLPELSLAVCSGETQPPRFDGVDVTLGDPPGMPQSVAVREPTEADPNDPTSTPDGTDMDHLEFHVNDPDVTRAMLWDAAQRIRWGSADPGERLAVGHAVARLDLPPDDPWHLAVSAALGSREPSSITEAADHFDERHAAASEVLLVGTAASIAGDHVRSRALLTLAASALDGRDDLPLVTQLLATQGWNDVHLGRWAEAADQASRASRLARETGQATWGVLAAVTEALIAALRGQDATAEAALARLGAATVGRADCWLASTITVARSIGDLTAGRIEAAHARLLDAVTADATAMAWAIDHLADAAVLTTKVEAARVLLGDRSLGGHARQGPLEVATRRYADAVLADDSSADERQLETIDALADWPVHAARLQLHRGRWLRRHRRVAESRAPLRAARDLFDAVGASRLAETARRELRASGERVRRREVTEWDQLSPQELEIANLASEGLSNREIGEQLFLSHRTVGAHLYRIFPKLGVTSRGQLHRALAGLEPAAGTSDAMQSDD